MVKWKGLVYLLLFVININTPNKGRKIKRHEMVK